jgi:hypothetical protein
MPAGIVLLLGLVGRLDRAAGQAATVGAIDLVLGITPVTLMVQRGRAYPRDRWARAARPPPPPVRAPVKR